MILLPCDNFPFLYNTRSLISEFAQRASGVTYFLWRCDIELVVYIWFGFEPVLRIWGTMNTEQWLLSPNRHLEFFGDVKAGATPYMKLLEDTVAQIEGMTTWLFSCRHWHKQSSGQVPFDAVEVAWGCWSFQSRCTGTKCPPGTFQPSRRPGMKCPRLGRNVPRQCHDSEAIHPGFSQTYDYIMTTCTSNSEELLAFCRFDRGTFQSGGRFRLLHRHISSRRKKDGRDGLL